MPNVIEHAAIYQNLVKALISYWTVWVQQGKQETAATAKCACTGGGRFSFFKGALLTYCSRDSSIEVVGHAGDGLQA